MMTSANVPMPPSATPRKAARIVKPARARTALGPPKVKLQLAAAENKRSAAVTVKAFSKKK